MGRCTAVEILELDERAPSHAGPETLLRDDQRLPLLEEIWRALTEAERRTISDRLAEKQHGVHAAEGQIGGRYISLREHCVRWLRRKRATAELSDANMRIKAAEFERNIGADAKQMLRDAEQPGEIDGYPHVFMRLDETERKP